MECAQTHHLLTYTVSLLCKGHPTAWKDFIPSLEGNYLETGREEPKSLSKRKREQAGRMQELCLVDQ